MTHDDFGVSTGTRVRCALLAALCAIAAFVVAGCGGASRAAPDGADDAQFVPAETPDHVPADAEFVRDMIVHHAQALEMTALVPDRSESDDMNLLARRIEETQEYEIGLMQDWLEKRGESGEGATEDGAGDQEQAGATGHVGMAGMASPEQMDALAAAEGPAFDRMFLELMIRHHEGALVMVDDLLRHEGAGQEPELFVLLSHIDADQRAEIARMQRMLGSME